VSSARDKLSWYHDPLPTNCVGDWVCAGGTGAGFPEYAHSPGPEHGYSNLAVFFHACSFNCLYCQNWTFLQHWGLDKTTSSIHTVPRSLITRLRVILRGFLPFLENERRLDGFPVGMAFDGVRHFN